MILEFSRIFIPTFLNRNTVWPHFWSSVNRERYPLLSFEVTLSQLNAIGWIWEYSCIEYRNNNWMKHKTFLFYVYGEQTHAEAICTLSLGCALFSMCSFWNVPFLECKQNRKGSFWMVSFLECAIFGMCHFWNVLFL